MKIMKPILTLLVVILASDEAQSGKEHWEAFKEHMKNWWNSEVSKHQRFWNVVFNKKYKEQSPRVEPEPEVTRPTVPPVYYIPQEVTTVADRQKGDRGFHKKGRFSVKAHFDSLFNKGYKGGSNFVTLSPAQPAVPKSFSLKGHFDKFFHKGHKGDTSFVTFPPGQLVSTKGFGRKSHKFFHKGGISAGVNIQPIPAQPFGHKSFHAKGHGGLFNKGHKSSVVHPIYLQENTYENSKSHSDLSSGHRQSSFVIINSSPTSAHVKGHYEQSP